MMSEILIGTGNKGKYAEIAAILEELPLRLCAPTDLKISDEKLEEVGMTYEENARIKLDFYQRASGLSLVLAEDSGLVVDALAGELGVNTRRWGAGEKAGDEEWLNYFLGRMQGESNRRAAFVCYAALFVNGKIKVFKGLVEGKITLGAEAPILPGLPLSSCFLAEGCEHVYAALSREEKAKVSHRAWAVGQVRDYLRDVLFRKKLGEI